jgi:branched-chain amino acid aminotransferase
MDTIIGNYYVIDNKLHNSSEVNFQFNNSEYITYEVLRTKRGVLLFLEDHLERSLNSIRRLNLEKLYNESELVNQLKLLVSSNSNREGNIKFLCKYLPDKILFAAYYIPHAYPLEDIYKNGIKLITYNIERNKPQIKQVSINEKINLEIRTLLQKGDVYEVLLVNHQGFITECSKANFFLIKGNSIFSAPEEFILEGITRKHILEIAKKLDLKNIPLLLKIKDLKNYDAAFICGTSPKVLPVKYINYLEFNVENETLRTLKDHYDILIREYFKKASEE